MTPILMLALHWEHLFLMIKSFSFHPVPVLSALLTTLHHSHTSAFYIPDFSLCTLDLLFSLVYFQMSQHFTPLRPAAGVYDARIYKLFTHFPFPWFYKQYLCFCFLLSVAVCSQPCLHGGKCVSPNKCRCRPPFSGPRCEERKKSHQCTQGSNNVVGVIMFLYWDVVSFTATVWKRWMQPV